MAAVRSFIPSGYVTSFRLRCVRAVKAIKSVDERLKVGGPATSNFIADNRHDGEIMIIKSLFSIHRI